MDTPIVHAEIVNEVVNNPVENIMVVKAQLKKTMVTLSRLIEEKAKVVEENHALGELVVGKTVAAGIAKEENIALKAQLEVSLQEIRRLKREASEKFKETRIGDNILIVKELGKTMRSLIVCRKENHDLKIELDGLKEWMV